MKKISNFLCSIILTILGVSMFSCGSYAQNQRSASQDKIQQSRQYRNGKFHNQTQFNLYTFKNIWAYIKDYTLNKEIDLTPRKSLPIKPVSMEIFQKEDDVALKFARLGHSTILLRIGEKLWLTDPVFSKRASPVQWTGPKRFHPVPVSIEDLPPIEAVIVSHNHFDHLDYDSIIKLKDRTKHFLVPLGVAKIIASWGVPYKKIMEFDWWDNVKFGDVEVIATPAQHFSGRGLFDSNETLWSSWVIKTDRHSVYFSGDSGYFEGFKKIGDKYGVFDIVFLECGAYNKNWRTIHMLPEDTIRSFKDLKGKLMVPVHNGTFNLSLHSWYDPMEEIMRLSKRDNIRVLIPYMGQVINGEHPPKTIAWWQTSPKKFNHKKLAHSAR